MARLLLAARNNSDGGAEVASRCFPSPPDADEKEVFELFDKYNLRSLAVVDAEGARSGRSPWTTWSRGCARICKERGWRDERIEDA